MVDQGSRAAMADPGFPWAMAGSPPPKKNYWRSPHYLGGARKERAPGGAREARTLGVIREVRTLGDALEVGIFYLFLALCFVFI